jgi:hypothetical protein
MSRSNGIDKRVRSLVAVLNKLHGCRTFSSCGGHAKPKNVTQEPASKFYVCFSLDYTRQAWNTLELITFAASVSDRGRGRISVRAWSQDTPETLSFELEGIRGSSPEHMATLLKALVSTHA